LLFFARARSSRLEKGFGGTGYYDPMQAGEGGHWEATCALKPGRYRYKFVVDGEWLHDPNAQENEPNERGSLNSVVQIRG